MGQAICRRCCPCCCPCCPHVPDPPATFPHLEITNPNEVEKTPKNTFCSFIKSQTNEEPDGDKRSIQTKKPSTEFIDLKKENNMLSGRDNPGFIEAPDTDKNSETEPQAQSIEADLSVTMYVPHPRYTQPNPMPSAKTSGKRNSNLSRATKVSTYNYKPRSSQDLDIKKGQYLEIIEDRGEWVIARTIDRNGKSISGYIPTTYLANEGSLEAEDWYFGSMTKLDAKRYLLQEENRSGSYLVWKKEEDDCYYMSVRKEQVVRHYRVHQSGSGSFYLVERASFSNLKVLVQYYCQQDDGLCTKLENPCVKLDLPSVESISHTTVDQLEIDPTSIQKVRKLGSGRFGTVWLGLWNGTTEVAVKELQVTAESLQKTLYGEAETMWKLSHEKLLKLYAVCLQTIPVFIVTEYMPQGNLKKYLKGHQKEKDLPFSQQVDFAVQISQGMKYMEQKGCVHRDLRSENILLSAMMSCKIGDFGLARFMESTSIALTADAQIPIKWTAPEVFLMQKYTSKSDLWSFGVLLVEIITYGKMPFPHKNNGQYRQDILSKKALHPPDESPEKISDIMRMCWRYEPASRPAFCEIEQFLMDLLSPMLDDEAVE